MTIYNYLLILIVNFSAIQLSFTSSVRNSSFSNYLKLDGCCVFIANETAKVYMDTNRKFICLESDFLNIEKELKNIEIYGNCKNTIEIVKFYNEGIENLNINNGKLSSLNDITSLSVFPLTNLSHNNLTEFIIERRMLLSSVVVLDLSYNQIRSVVVESFESFPVLKSLYLNNNKILTYDVDQKMSFTYLDLSNNPLNFLKSSKNLFNENLKCLYLSSVDYLKTISCNATIRIDIPFYLEELILHNNRLNVFPSIGGIFKETSLLSLDLSFNKIRRINTNFFAGLTNLKHLNLSNNEIVVITPDVLDRIPQLIALDLSENYLQHIHVKFFDYFLRKSKNLPIKPQLKLSGNFFECDCTMVELHNYLSSVSNTFTTTFKCLKNNSIAVILTSVSLEELVCYPPELKYVNSSKVNENNPGEVSCVFMGRPKPKVKWITPNNKTTISIDSINSLDDFDLSPFGNTLYVRKLKYKLTGKYKCIGYNGIDQSNSTVVTIAMIPSSFSAFIVVGGATISFIIALIINFTNLTLYLIDHIRKQNSKRKYREQQLLNDLDNYDNIEFEEAIDKVPKLVRKSAISLDDLSKHEYSTPTCHDYLLDTMAKGAHTVKKTINDARNYQFHFNVVAYASNLRDRMYNIEMPSTSFQLPNIPTMDIEKISTTVREKSHNIATSVGSVLTFKRFLKEQSSTESEGKCSSEKKDIVKNNIKDDCDSTNIVLSDVIDS